MASFAVTFAIGTLGMFIPIASAVQKIAQDEFDIHVEMDKAIIAHELSLPRGQEFLNRRKQDISDMYHEIVDVEESWVDYMGFEENPMPGTTAAMFKGFIRFCAGDAMRVWNIKPEFVVPRTNPAQYMDRWLDISKIQNSPQEQESGQYKMNVMRQTLGDTVIDPDF